MKEQEIGGDLFDRLLTKEESDFTRGTFNGSVEEVKFIGEKYFVTATIGTGKNQKFMINLLFVRS